MIQNIFANTLKTLMDICVGITQYFVSLIMKPLITKSILLVMQGIIMLRPIKFYHKFGRCNVKINNVISKGFLPMNSNGQLLQKIIP